MWNLKNRIKRFLKRHVLKRLIPYALIYNTKAITIKWKSLLLFFIVYLMGSWIGSYITGFLGLSAGADWFSYIFVTFIPVACIYFLWQYIKGKV